MKLLLLTDLHREFQDNSEFLDTEFVWPDESEYDVVVLGGDIDTGLNGIQWAKQKFTKPMLYIPGNHEFYIRTPMMVLQSSFDNIPEILNPGVFEQDGVTIIGATLWSYATLNGYPDTRYLIERSISDFRFPYDHINYFNVSLMQRMHENDFDFIEEEIRVARNKGNKVVVVTHFLPSQECCDPQYKDDPLSPYFMSDSDELVKQADIWMYGHTHTRGNIMHSSGVQMYCNPLGYPGREQSDPYCALIVEV